MKQLRYAILFLTALIVALTAASCRKSAEDRFYEHLEQSEKQNKAADAARQAEANKRIQEDVDKWKQHTAEENEKARKAAERLPKGSLPSITPVF